MSPSREIPILMYHRVLDSDPRPSAVPVRRFRDQMRHLSRMKFHSLTCGQLAEAVRSKNPLPTRPVLITFDDGYLDNYKNAFPVLQEFGMVATVFLVSSQINGWNAWETNPTVPKFRLMDMPMIKAMVDTGMEFGSHTCSHVPLNKVPLDKAEQEMVQSKRRLEDMLGLPVRSLAYPYNGYSADIKRLAAEYGYTNACTAGDGPRPLLKHLSLDLFELRRIAVPHSCTLAEFKIRVSGYYLFLKDLGDKKKWRGGGIFY